MELIIKGDSKKVKKLAKEISLKCKRKRLVMSFGDEKVEKDFLNVKDTAALIASITDLSELDQFDSDERKGVISVLNARRLELNSEE